MNITLINAFFNILNDYMEFHQTYYYEICNMEIMKHAIKFCIKEDNHIYILKIIYENNHIMILNDDGQDCIYDFLVENGINKFDADNFYLRMKEHVVKFI